MAPINVTYPPRHEILTYPLAILRGTVSKSSVSEIFISVRKPSVVTSVSVPVRGRHFTAVYHLDPGTNHIEFSLNPDLSEAHTFTLVYERPTETLPSVRLVYCLTSDSDGSFQSPDASSNASGIAEGIRRLQTAGLMIQAATAEMLNAQNLGRRTFRLSPDVYVHRLQNLTTQNAHTMSGVDLWSHISGDLQRHSHRHDVIDVVVMSFTRLIDGKVKAHTALGGGQLALFGGGSLFTWPSTVEDIARTMLDNCRFDSRQFFDDSAGRAASMGKRACTSTTIGALLHELGHCLSLPHPCGIASINGGGIMARGFDFFDRLFVQSHNGDALPFWDRGSAVRLRYHRFLKFDGEDLLRSLEATRIQVDISPSPSPAPTPAQSAQSSRSNPVPPQPYGPPSFRKKKNGDVLCSSSAGLGHIGYYKNGDNAFHEEFIDSNPSEFVLPALKSILKNCQAQERDNIVLSAIDVDGRIADIDYSQLKP